MNRKFTIVTPSLNQGQYLEEAICSVLSQGYENLDYFVMDGGSTDGSVEIIRRYQHGLAGWNSRKDDGQASVLGKALESCRGGVFHWLNSDDRLRPGAIHAVANAFGESCDAVAGAVSYFGEGRLSKVARNRGLTASALAEGPHVPFWRRTLPSYHQPGVFLDAEKLRAVGGIDGSFRYVFDFDMTIRYLHRFPKVRYIDDVLVDFRLHPASKTVGESTPFFDEWARARGKLLSLGEYAPLHGALRLALREDEWRRSLKQMDGIPGPSATRAMTVLGGLLRSPARRVDRRVLGLLRRQVVPEAQG